MSADITRNITAVVLLHGIGEQRPMTTLRSFVSGVFGQEGRSKPARQSNLFEVRRLTLDKRNVHCFELYWAHHMTSSTMTHIAKWLLRLHSVPCEELRKMARFLDRGENFYTTISAVASVFFSLSVGIVFASSYALNKWGLFSAGTAALLASASITAIGLVWRWVQNQMVEVVGDAARYLDSTPANVGVRQAIRAECIQFFEKLNQDKDYSRIVVIGHSLGSVIAYDALRLMWAQLNPHMTLHKNDDTVNALSWLHGNFTFNDHQKDTSPQRELFKQIFSLEKQPWKISDLVTVGSPLAHAPLLFAEKFHDFESLKKQRELPTCPPQKDDGDKPYGEGKDQGIDLHHAAVFAVVDWTNFYFPSDPIGGRLSPLFGSGIHDIKLEDAQDNSWINHVRYWDRGHTSGSKKFKQEILSLIDQSVHHISSLA